MGQDRRSDLRRDMTQRGARRNTLAWKSQVRPPQTLEGSVSFGEKARSELAQMTLGLWFQEGEKTPTSTRVSPRLILAPQPRCEKGEKGGGKDRAADHKEQVVERHPHKTPYERGGGRGEPDWDEEERV